MTPELLRTELAHAEEAELRSDEQVRELTGLIDTARSPSATIDPSDCLKLITAALAVNCRLREQTERLRKSLRCAELNAVEAHRAT